MNDLERFRRKVLGGAGSLQQMTVDSEREQRESGIEYSDQHVKQSTVHTREDLVLLVYHAGAINNQTKRIYIALVLLIFITGADFISQLM